MSSEREPAPVVATPRKITEGSHETARYVGAEGSRVYHLYLPAGLRKTVPVPLVIALHGCRQSPDEFAAATRLNQLADQQGFLIAYPEQTESHNFQRCWNWFEGRHQHHGSGEPAILAGIAQDVTAQRTNWLVDPARVYVVGMSAGGSMALVLGATYPDVFAAVGAHSATPYASASDILSALAAMGGRADSKTENYGPLPPAPTIIFQGGRDTTVHPSTAMRITDSWLTMRARYVAEDASLARISRQRHFPHADEAGTHAVTRWYGSDGRLMLESWGVEELPHAWSGGDPDADHTYPEGPRATTEMWRFLSRHKLPESVAKALDEPEELEA